MNFNEIEDIIEEYDFLNEGAYSNGRYEHPDDKKVRKYHPGHANPAYTHTGYINGKPYINRWAAMPDDFRGRWENPMNNEYSNYNFEHGREGTGTNYRKGEIPNGYMVWSREDEAALKAAWEKLSEVVKSCGIDRYPLDCFNSSYGRHYIGKYSPFKTNVQKLRAQKAVDEYDKLVRQRERVQRNNKKYDNSRSDSQIKKDARLWEKDKEHFDYIHNGKEKTPQTQSKKFRKRVNGELIRTAFKERKDFEKQQKRKEKEKLKEKYSFGHYRKY